MLGVPRVAGEAEEGVLGVRGPPELGGVRLADHHTAGLAEACDQERVRGGGGSVGEEHRAEGGAKAGRILEVFDGQRQAGEGTRVDARGHHLVNRPSLLERVSLVDRDEGVEGAVVAIDDAQGVGGQLHRTDLTGSDLAGERGQRFSAEVQGSSSARSQRA